MKRFTSFICSSDKAVNIFPAFYRLKPRLFINHKGFQNIEIKTIFHKNFITFYILYKTVLVTKVLQQALYGAIIA